MRINKTLIYLMATMFGLMMFMPSHVDARKRLLPGRSEGMASVKVKASDIEAIAQAVKQVFEGDGYNLKGESLGGLQFSRSAGRMKDFSYGGLVSSGTWEQVMVNIDDLGGGSYQISCDVYMTEGDSTPSSIDTKVLGVFGKEYKRMLRRVKRKLN